MLHCAVESLCRDIAPGFIQKVTLKWCYFCFTLFDILMHEHNVCAYVMYAMPFHHKNFGLKNIEVFFSSCFGFLFYV